jgi:hypothetical protein
MVNGAFKKGWPKRIRQAEQVTLSKTVYRVTRLHLELPGGRYRLSHIYK